MWSPRFSAHVPHLSCACACAAAQIMRCDGILEHMEGLLGRFQSDLGQVSDEIRTLQVGHAAYSLPLTSFGLFSWAAGSCRRPAPQPRAGWHSRTGPLDTGPRQSGRGASHMLVWRLWLDFSHPRQWQGPWLWTAAALLLVPSAVCAGRLLRTQRFLPSSRPINAHACMACLQQPFCYCVAGRAPGWCRSSLRPCPPSCATGAWPRTSWAPSWRRRSSARTSYTKSWMHRWVQQRRFLLACACAYVGLGVLMCWGQLRWGKASPRSTAPRECP